MCSPGVVSGVEVEQDGAGDVPLEDVVAAQAGDQVLAAAADRACCRARCR